MLKINAISSHTQFEEILLMVISSILVIGSVCFAVQIYLKKPRIAEMASSKFNVLYKLLLNKYFVDEIYEAAVVQPIQKGSERLLWIYRLLIIS